MLSVCKLDIRQFDYFGKRYYDPGIGRFLTVDRFADMYPSLTPYHYAANNPINVIDINGDSTFVVGSDNGTYTVTGGNLSGDENDTGVYIRNADGSVTQVGNSVTTHSFFGDDGNAVVGAVIDPSSTEGQNFVDNEIVAGDPAVVPYMANATGGEALDFKTRGIENRAEGVTAVQYMYRGSVTKDGAFGSARDFGNIGAGIVAGRKGLSWGVARLGFDGLQSIQDKRLSREGTPTQKAQKVGHNIGVQLRKKDQATKNIWRKYVR